MFKLVNKKTGGVFSRFISREAYELYQKKRERDYKPFANERDEWELIEDTNVIPFTDSRKSQ
jgi:hypothetical protein